MSSCRATSFLVRAGLLATARDAIPAGSIMLQTPCYSPPAKGACLWGLGEVARDLSGGLAGPSGSCSSSSAIPLILGTPAGVACSLGSSSPAGKPLFDLGHTCSGDVHLVSSSPAGELLCGETPPQVSGKLPVQLALCLALAMHAQLAAASLLCLLRRGGFLQSAQLTVLPLAST